MAITETSQAYLNGPKDIHVGNFDHNMLYTIVATASASANALTVLGQKVQKGIYIMEINGQHTSGAASCPCDIGLDASLSLFGSQVTQGVNVTPASFKGGVFPYQSTVSDDAAALYQTMKYSLTPGTNTTGVILNYTVRLARDPI